VLDWGVRRLDRPGLVVDHHVPEAEPRSDQIVVSGHGEEPETSTAPLLRRLVSESPAWLAAVGAHGDLSDRAWRLPECEGAPRGAVRPLVPLVNAPRRLPDGPVLEALALLVDSESPAAALSDPRAELLEDARREWRSGFEQAVRTAPKVSERVAVLRFSSPYQVHPLVATAWSRRLAPRVVLAANDGYLPGRVNFAVRGGEGDLRELLRAALPEQEGEFAHGHPRATGGSLEPEDFDRLLGALGAAA
jgi:single-stranded-DNA-specific exonuclease